MEIVGPGDPSGRGLGFSYLRVATKPPNAGALVEKKAAAARGGGAVTGTDADLRRLSMEAAREVLALSRSIPSSLICSTCSGYCMPVGRSPLSVLLEVGIAEEGGCSFSLWRIH